MTWVDDVKGGLRAILLEALVVVAIVAVALAVAGIAIAVASIIIMPALYLAKNRTGRALKSKSLIADSKETLACSFLSVALLAGLLMNYLFGLWQADPVVGIIIAVFLVNEGREVLEGEDDDD